MFHNYRIRLGLLAASLLLFAIVVWRWRRAARGTRVEIDELALPYRPEPSLRAEPLAPIDRSEPSPVEPEADLDISRSIDEKSALAEPLAPGIEQLVSGEQPDVTPAAPGEDQHDDLTIVEGIGPKISALLGAAGINTFAQLAAADEGRLREILLEARLRMADPRTWPEQARLAAEGDWEGLKTLQRQLKAGRRQG